MVDHTDIFSHGLTFLSARCLERVATASPAMRALARAPLLWDPLVDALWRGKSVTPALRAVRAVRGPRVAYVASLRESARTTITRDDLLSLSEARRYCFDTPSHARAVGHSLSASSLPRLRSRRAAGAVATPLGHSLCGVPVSRRAAGGRLVDPL